MIAYNPEHVNNPAAIADRQRILGAEWAGAYSRHVTAEEPVLRDAEIALRNPTVYLNNPVLVELPEDLQQQWKHLLGTTEILVTLADTAPREWGSRVNSVEKLHGCIRDGNLDAKYKIEIARAIDEASQLFAQSYVMRQGKIDSGYYAGNVSAMETQLRRYLY